MAGLILAVAALLVLVTLGLIAWYTHLTSRDRLIRDTLLVRYVVTLKNGDTFDALLRDVDGRTLELVQVKSVATGRDPIPVDGALLVFRSDVAYMQRP